MKYSKSLPITNSTHRWQRTALAAGLSGVLLALLATAGTASGQTVPALMNYQGKLVDPVGSPMANGSYDVAFKIWKKANPADVADALVWGQTNAVTLVNGIFNLALGGPGGVITSASKTNLVDAFDEPGRYLSLTIVRNPAGAVAAPAEMLPRQQMLSAPYALKSAVATEAVNAFNGVPPGCILPFGGSSVPSEFLLCNGSAVSRSAYAKLFSAIGTAWGQGDGYNTFNVPDLRGSFPAGRDAAQGEFANLAHSSGEKAHTLSWSEMPAHRHDVVSFEAGESANANDAYGNPGTRRVVPNYGYRSGSRYYSVLRTDEAGLGQPHNNLPPYRVVNYIIKY